jgi:LemA protein
MSLLETIEKHPEIAAHEVDDVIGIAARLQDEKRATKPGVTPEELRAVAAELDIDPSLVEQALGLYRQEQAASVQAAAGRRTTLLVVAGVLTAMLVAGVLAVGAMAATGASRLEQTQRQVQQAELALDAVLDRQAALLPQLAGLAGADASALERHAAAVGSAPDVEGRLRAAQALGTAMANQLGALPAPENEAESQLRLNLQYEIAGSTNRITAERRRYDAARAGWDNEAATSAGSWALRLGMAEALE